MLEFRSQVSVESPHRGDDDGELDLKKDDVVTVLLKRDDYWWVGEIEEKRGLFPAENVKEIKGTVVDMSLLSLPQYMSV